MDVDYQDLSLDRTSIKAHEHRPVQKKGSKQRNKLGFVAFVLIASICILVK